MIRPVLSPRDRRTLGMGVGIILAIVTLARGVPATLAWRAHAVERARLVRDEVARATGLLARRRVVGESLAVRTARLTAAAPSLIGGTSPASAAATLTGLVSGAAARSGVRIASTQVIAGDTARTRELPVARARVDAVGDVTGVTRMLAELEGGSTLLRVRSLSISQPEPAAPSEKAEALRVELVVEGLSLAPAAGGEHAP